LRPERVKIDPMSNGLANIVDGCIEEIIYLGDHVRTRLTVTGQPDFIVKVPNNAERPPLKEGMKVKVGWSTEDCRALDDV
jgi:putative spermidine/putrescine transport system ATP-binding protein